MGDGEPTAALIIPDVRGKPQGSFHGGSRADGQAHLIAIDHRAAVLNAVAVQALTQLLCDLAGFLRQQWSLFDFQQHMGAALEIQPQGQMVLAVPFRRPLQRCRWQDTRQCGEHTEQNDDGIGRRP